MRLPGATRGAPGALLAAALCLFGALAPPVHADEEELRQQIQELRTRLERLEKELAESRKAPPAPAPASTPATTPAPVAAALTARNGSRLQVSGFTQVRITNIQNPSGDRIRSTDVDFQVTRFRPRFVYLMDPHLQAHVQLNASTRSGAPASVNARDVYLQYVNPGIDLKLGQAKIPFGYQVYREGDETRAALERARVMGLLFPDERDIGLFAATAPRNPRAPIFAAGVFNGDGLNRTDVNHAKGLAANAVVPAGRLGTFGASLYSGMAQVTTASGAVEDRVKRAYGLEHRLTLGRLSTQLEYVWGRHAGRDLNGGFGQLLYNTGDPGSFFVRHDVLDPDEAAGHDYWHNTTLGWYRDFTRQFRLSAEYNLIRNRAAPAGAGGNNTFGVQAQANF